MNANISRTATACFILIGWLSLATSAEAGVLLSQLDNALGSGRGITSQDFETALDAFDTQAADDFSVPVGQVWWINEVFVDGFFVQTGTGPVTSANVFIYANDAGLPGGLLDSTNSTPATQSGDGDLTIPVNIQLDPGDYWVSVQAEIDFRPDSNQWAWARREPATGEEGVWENPGDGFGGATTWTPLSEVFDLDGTTDMVFELRGHDLVPEPATILVWAGLGLLGFAYSWRRRRR